MYIKPPIFMQSNPSQITKILNASILYTLDQSSDGETSWSVNMKVYRQPSKNPLNVNPFFWGSRILS